MKRTTFFTGLHLPSKASHFEHCMISINILERRKSDFYPNKWILDSGAFMRITMGKGHMLSEEYMRHVKRWSTCGELLAAVSQDFMCEQFVLQVTGLTVREHQMLTVDNFKRLLTLNSSKVYIMPVLQGFTIDDYLRNVEDYGDLLANNKWVGIGSVCKRNRNVSEIENIVSRLKEELPHVDFHGFGIKKTALASHMINQNLYSADSMAWSFAARKNGGGQNDWRLAMKYEHEINEQVIQGQLWPMGVHP